MQRAILCVFFGLIASSVCARADDPMNVIAEKYVHLVLALGQHDPDYVDAFYGPAEWKTQAEKEKQSLDAIGAESKELSGKLAEMQPRTGPSRTGIAATEEAKSSGDE